MDEQVTPRLDGVQVVNPAGEAVRLGSLWAGRPVVLALVRHFG